MMQITYSPKINNQDERKIKITDSVYIYSLSQKKHTFNFGPLPPGGPQKNWN